MKKDVLILTSRSGDWEGLFIDGLLISEGHHLGKGDNLYMLKQSEIYDFKAADVRQFEVNEADEDYLMDCGNFPNRLTELYGIY